MFANFTEETCVGTGATLALAGATSGNIAFQESFSDGDLVAYVVEDSGGTIKVAGVGIYVSATDDITRNDTWNWNGTVIDDNPSTNITLGGGNHTVRCDAVGQGLKGFLQPLSNDKYLSGRANYSNNVFGVLDADTVYVMPFLIEHSGSYDGVRIRVNATGTATKARIALFSINNDTTLNAQLVETSDIDVSTTGGKIASITQQELSQGWFYIAIIADGTVTIDNQDGTQEAQQGLWGIVGDFSTRGGTHGKQVVSSGWSTFPSITDYGTRDVNNCPAIALVAL